MIFSGISGRARFGLLFLCGAAFAGCGGDSRPSSPPASARSANPSVAQGGRIVVFESGASVVVVDRVNATSLVIGENDGVANSVVTPDGRFVAFDAQPAGVATRQVFLRDLATGETTLVSASSGDTPGTGNSTNPSLSDDGRFVTFQSNAVDLGARSASSSSVLVRDVAEATTRSASAFSTGDDLNPAISGNGQFVAFESRPLEGFSEVLQFNRLNAQVTPVSRVENAPPPNGSSGEPSLSFDGRIVAFESRATNLTPATPATSAFATESNILVRDVLTGTLVPASVSLTPGVPANGDSRNPTISRDGRRVAFDSTATNLTADVVQPGTPNVFVRDLSTDTTELVTQPEPVSPPPTPPAPSGLTTSTPVVPIGTTGGLVTSVPVLPSGSSTGTPPPPTTPVTPVVPSEPAAPTPVPPTAPAEAVITTPPVTPLTPASGLTTSTPVEPIAPVGTGTLSTSAPVSGLSTSTPVSGLVTSAPVGSTGTTSASTGITVVFATAPPGSRRPSISPDGAWVAFESRDGIFLANLQTKEITPVRRPK
jgi:Tol biopolymer transport system component